MNNTISYKGKDYFVTIGIGVAIVPVEEVAHIKVIDDDKVYDVTLFSNQEAVINHIDTLSLPGRLRKHHINTIKDAVTPSYSVVNEDGTVMFFNTLEEAKNYQFLNYNCPIYKDGEIISYSYKL